MCSAGTPSGFGWWVSAPVGPTLGRSSGKRWTPGRRPSRWPSRPPPNSAQACRTPSTAAGSASARVCAPVTDACRTSARGSAPRALRPTTRNRSGCLRSTSIAWVPIDPVEPSRMTVRGCRPGAIGSVGVTPGIVAHGRPRRPGRGGMIRLMVKDSQLAAGETVVFTAHSHWKNIVVPVLVTGVVAAAAVLALLNWVPSPQDQAWQRWAIVAVAGLLVLVFGIWPISVWLASTDTLTTRRLISRRGVFSREGKDIPIDRVQSVSYRRSLLDRMLGCGTLVVQTAGESSDVELYDVAHIERRLLQVQEIILDEEIPAEGTPDHTGTCLLYTSPSPRDGLLSRMPSSA